MCSVMMLSSLIPKLLKFLFEIRSSKLTNLFFLTLVHLSLLSAFGVDAWIFIPCLLVVCLLTIIHMVWWLYVKNIHSLRRFSTLVMIGGGGYRVLAKLSHTRSRHFERVLAMYTKPRGHNDETLELWLGRVSFRFLIFEVSLSPSFNKRWNLRI